MVKSFRDALLAALEDHGMSLARVAEASGVSYEQLKKLKQRENSTTSVDDARLVATKAFGQTLDQFLGDQSLEGQLEIVALYNQLSDQERRYLLAAAKGFLAEDHHRK